MNSHDLKVHVRLAEVSNSVVETITIIITIPEAY